MLRVQLLIIQSSVVKKNIKNSILFPLHTVASILSSIFTKEVQRV